VPAHRFERLEDNIAVRVDEFLSFPRRVTSGGSAWYQSSFLPVRVSRAISPTTWPAFHITPSCIMKKRSRPRRAASTIMA